MEDIASEGSGRLWGGFGRFQGKLEGWEVDNIDCLCFPKVFEGWKILIFHWFFKVFEGGGGGGGREKEKGRKKKQN